MGRWHLRIADYGYGCVASNAVALPLAPTDELYLQTKQQLNAFMAENSITPAMLQTKLIALGYASPAAFQAAMQTPPGVLKQAILDA